jgi:hypothetical protein
MDTQKVLGGVAVAIALILVSVGVSRLGYLSDLANLGQVQQQSVFGALSSNQPTEPIYLQGGSASKIQGFNSTTTIPCEIQNTTGATTTFSARFLSTTATTTTTVLAIATSTNAGKSATTTAIVSVTIAANALGAGTYVGANNQNIIGPGEWVTVGYGAGTTLPTVAQAQPGYCAVTFDNFK